MKTRIQNFIYSVAMVLAISSCFKSPEIVPSSSNQVLPSFFPTLNREYFWSQRWDSTSRGYEIHLYPSNLTDSAINKGIAIGVALYSDWDPFVKIPCDYFDYAKSDTVHFSYVVRPGALEVIAKAAFAITYPSDIFIEYK